MRADGRPSSSASRRDSGRPDRAPRADRQAARPHAAERRHAERADHQRGRRRRARSPARPPAGPAPTSSRWRSRPPATWSTPLFDGFTDATPHRMAPLEVAPAGGAAGGGSDLPSPQMIAIAVVALLFRGCVDRDVRPAERRARAPAAVPSRSVRTSRERYGVGPPGRPWPDDPRLDPGLLAGGDRRNVVDGYRYWRRDAIVADLDAAGTRSTSRSRTGSTTSTSGRSCATPTRSWRRRSTSWAAAAGTGAARWSPTATSTSATTPRSTRSPTWAGRPAGARHRQPAGRRAIDAYPLPERCALLFGQEGPGALARGPRARGLCWRSASSARPARSTRPRPRRSAMHEWIRRHAARRAAPGRRGRPRPRRR